jgi:hypothetical protein
VDQQKALQRLSNSIVRDIQNAVSHEPKDLESVIMRALSTTFARKDVGPENQLGQTPNAGSSSKHNVSNSITEAMAENGTFKTTKESFGANKKAPMNRPRRQGSTSASLKCERCPVTVARACDMRKHMKRHTRPYGCTYPKCNKRFGAKSDWKRHENSQHFQLESFRCALPSPHLQTPCGELFYRSKAFEKHLAEEHKMHEQSAREHEVKMRRIGKNGQGQFWCGFCERIVKLEKKRTMAWDERFDHIDRHFNRDKRRIEEWHCVEARKPKGEVLREMDKYVFDDDDTEAHSPEDEGDEESATPPTTSAPEPAGPSTSMSNPRKRHANGDAPSNPPSQKRIKRELLKYCVSISASLPRCRAPANSLPVSMSKRALSHPHVSSLYGLRSSMVQYLQQRRSPGGAVVSGSDREVDGGFFFCISALALFRYPVEFRPLPIQTFACTLCEMPNM